jgi:hypothetical protein
MWLAILGILDKVFGALGQLLGFWIKRSDASLKKRNEEQAKMDEAEKVGDFDAWKKARSRRNRA